MIYYYCDIEILILIRKISHYSRSVRQFKKKSTHENLV